MSYRSLRYKYYIYLNTDVIYTWIHTLSNCFNLQGPSPSGQAQALHTICDLCSHQESKTVVTGLQEPQVSIRNGLF